MARTFTDRHDAGRQLAQRLEEYRNRSDVLVLALPRGGVPVAYEIAAALHAPLDVFLVRKLGVPGHEELAMGAIASGGIRVVNMDVLRYLQIDSGTIDEVARQEARVLRECERLYRVDRTPEPIAGRVIILVDDGLATGASMRAAIQALREQHPREIVVAVPVASAQACELIGAEVDRIVCATTPEDFSGVSQSYANFDQTSNAEVQELLQMTASTYSKSVTSHRV